MVGDPASIVIADSYKRGLTDFDLGGVYPVMVRQALVPNPQRPGLASLDQYGYIPMDDTGGDFVWGQVSTALEYALSDWNIAELGEALGDTQTSNALRARASSYKYYFDTQTGFLRPRNKDGSWYSPFNPDTLFGGNNPNGWGGPGYVEGNAWQYTFFVPHDVLGLRDSFGSDSAFTDKLWQTFQYSKFALDNEPDMAYPYLFTHFAGQAYRTQELVRSALVGSFGDGADGLPGNDDTGTLSAWLVFGALGFYPDHPGSLRYSLGSPLFDKATIYLSDGGWYSGKTFVIEAHHNAADHPYIQSARLNGKPHSSAELSHEEITQGGVLELEMAAQP
jgi:predicted alpha-1,2-mannosidase